MALRTATGDRRLNLRGCFNFRDLGGYRTTDGLRVRWGRLYRSDSLHQLTPADQKEVAALGLASVVDLRTPEEIAEQGWARVQTTVYHLPMVEAMPPIGTEGCSAEAAQIAESYYSMLVAGYEEVREILAILTDPSSYPAVVCCPSGVDRTGIVTALVLGLLGVPDDVVVGDYTASREATLRRMGRLRFEHPTAVRHDLDRYGPGLLGVVPEAMARFLRLVQAEHGSVAGYAESLDMAGAVPYLHAALLHARG